DVDTGTMFATTPFRALWHLG
ncbi:hypothetical protein EVA_01984, partial [gut metagenome]